MKSKKRNIYAYEDFLGLDKENKKLKVNHHRASDGYNFMIDSGTLKTRPAISFKGEPGFSPRENEKVLGWHDYNGGRLYITNKYFYFEKDGTTISNEILSDESNVTKISDLNLDDTKEPLFREEKDALFIFGLGTVFIFSFFDNKAIFYDIRDKVDNPFGLLDEENYDRFEDLPKPYIPTLFIGTNRFDDVNLLSDTFRYELFSGTQSQEGHKIPYNLVTHYDQEKHGNFEHEVEFYGGRLDNLDVLPIFMGIENNDFDEDDKISQFGPSYTNNLADSGSESNPLRIANTYDPGTKFQVLRDTIDNTEEESSKIFSLNANLFFSMRVEGLEKTVFEFFMDFFKENQAMIEDWETNKYFVLLLPYEVTKVIKDKETDFVISEEKERNEIKVYVQMRKFDIKSIDVDGISLDSRRQENRAYDYTKPYPVIHDPIIFNGEEETKKEYDLNDGYPILVNQYTSHFKRSMVSSFLQSKRNELSGVNQVKINAKFYEEKNGSFNQSIGNFYIIWKDYVTEANEDPYYEFEYPYVNLGEIEEEGYTEDYIGYDNFINIGPIETDQNYAFDDDIISDFENIKEAIENELTTNQVDKLDGYASGTALMRLYAYHMNGDLHDKTTMILRVGFTKDFNGDYEKRYNVETIYALSIDEGPIVDDLYDFEYDNEKKAFSLKVKDYFFDYNNEPSIVLKTKFQHNPDFEKIANMRFGITFGSENRLFLAGDPNHANLDRYNVSNALLGGNVKNQSYELSFFPSKNYRVLGGKSAINGYVVATDSQLYVTKEPLQNDDVFYIRERHLSDEGQVTYFEHKTNIMHSPINNKCILRFYNDILVLSKNGLYGIEISSDVLTNQRLVRMRSGFINEEIIEAIKENDNIFTLANKHNMYMFIGNNVYVADSRYINENPNGIIDNMNYEIVKWKIPFNFKQGTIKKDEIILLSENENVFYNFEFKNKDDDITRVSSMIVSETIENYGHFYHCIFSNEFDYILENPKKYTLKLNVGFITIAKNIPDEFNDYGVTILANQNNKIRIEVINHDLFKSLIEGDTVYIGLDHEAKIEYYDESRDYFDLDLVFSNQNVESILVSVADKPLYIRHVYDIDDDEKAFRVSLNEPELVFITKKESDETIEEYRTRLTNFFQSDEERNDLRDVEGTMYNAIINKQELIETRWLSAITSFNNDLMEKTMFRVNLYATRMSKENEVLFGYRTMKTVREDEFADKVPQIINLANPLNLEQFNFNIFSLSTFSEMGTSFPMKENNFLYIQFLVQSFGQIEINGFKVIFKNNRGFKTMG